MIDQGFTRTLRSAWPSAPLAGYDQPEGQWLNQMEKPTAHWFVKRFEGLENGAAAFLI